ncbi:MAG: hypothetical protein GX060_03775 [Firmicutes bacterium]|nr:hypothetical protein [Bacillota bacterium]
MRREVPLIITFVVGVIVLFANMFEGPLQAWSSELTGWLIIVSAFAVGLASVNLFRIHGTALMRMRPGWFNSLALIVALIVFAVIGTMARLGGDEKINNLNQNLYDSIIGPLGAAMFAMLAFYVASAAYRAFRMRSAEATVMLIAAILTMIGKAPIGELIWNKFPVIAEWLIDIPNTAGQRAIMIGAAIGAFATSLRILLGLERGHLGGAE